MAFKVLDIEKDASAQGFVEHSYDMIIASFVIHATSKLEQTLKNVRRLLKPGGYLLMLEVTNLEQSRLGFIFGSLPGWWLGGDDGRSLSPCVTSAEWDVLLRKTGFSGIDSVTPDLDSLPFPASALATQAVDPCVEFLRDPLSSAYEIIRSNKAMEQLVILGGNTMTTAKLSNTISGLLQDHCHQITRVKALEGLLTDAIPPMATILNLIELDEPIFKSMNKNSLAGLKALFDKSKNILWITQGCRADNPYLNQSLGFGRSMLVEMPNVCSQFLDIECLEESTPQTIAQALLRFTVVDFSEQPDLGSSLLWSTEPEFALENGKEMIPRIVPNKSQNDRYNSLRRLITKEVDINDSPLSITCSGTSYAIRQESNVGPVSASNGGHLTVEVSHSVLTSVRVAPNVYLFLVLGRVSKTDNTIIALSKSNASLVRVPTTWSIPCPPGTGSLSLFVIFTHLMTLAILEGLSDGQTLAILEPDSAIATVLARQAAKRNIRVVYLTTTSGKVGPLWVSVHEHASMREIYKSLPRNVSAFLNMLGTKSFASRIEACLPPLSRRENISSLLRATSHAGSSPTMVTIQELLRSTSSHSEEVVQNLGRHSIPTVTLKEVQSIAVTRNEVLVVDWKSSGTATVKLEPVDQQPLLSNNKTYWLVGLTGSLGISLCQWMVSHGAKYVVLTSRNPKIDKRLLDDMEATSATVKVIPGYGCIIPYSLSTY